MLNKNETIKLLEENTDKFLYNFGQGKGFLTSDQNPETGLPWWHSGWESACQCRGHRFNPWSGKIPHDAEQLSPCATTTGPAPVLCNKRSHRNEKPAHRNEAPARRN